MYNLTIPLNRFLAEEVNVKHNNSQVPQSVPEEDKEKSEKDLTFCSSQEIMDSWTWGPQPGIYVYMYLPFLIQDRFMNMTQKHCKN